MNEKLFPNTKKKNILDLFLFLFIVKFILSSNFLQPKTLFWKPTSIRVHAKPYSELLLLKEKNVVVNISA